MADAILAQSGIYAIRNKVNSKVYIGQSVHIARRKSHHFYLLRRGIHTCRYMQHAFTKYGEDSFEFAILELCDEAVLTAREQFWMDSNRYLGLYNLTPAAASNKGVKYSDESKAKMSAASKGRKSRLGHKNTPEANALVAAARRGKKMSDETKAKIAAIHLGRKLSPEHRAKMSAALRNVPRTDEWRKKQSIAATGRKLSAETIEKLRQSRLGKKEDPEHAARRIAAASAAKAAKKLTRSQQTN